MKPRWFATLLIGAVFGTCLGVLILVVACKYDSDPLGKLIEIICAPAIWCAHYWTYVLDLPPHGEAGFVVVPMTAMVWGGGRRAEGCMNWSLVIGDLSLANDK